MEKKYDEPFLEPILRTIRFRKVISKISPKSIIIDIGCGHTPNLLNRLETYIKRGIGIDPLIIKGRRGKIKLLSRFLTESIPFKNNYADHVTLVAVLEHLDNPQRLLNESYRVLKKGGTLLLTTPTPMNKPLLEFLSFKLGLVSRREIEEHKKYYWKNELVDSIKKCGFTSVYHEYFELRLNNFIVASK